MGEDARQHAAFQALEQLLEPAARTLQQVLRTSRPLSGEDFEQVVDAAIVTCLCLHTCHWFYCMREHDRGHPSGMTQPFIIYTANAGRLRRSGR